MASYTDLQKKNAENMHAQQKLVKQVKSRERLEMLWERTCVDVSLLQLKKFESGKGEIAVEEHSSLPSGKLLSRFVQQTKLL